MLNGESYRKYRDLWTTCCAPDCPTNVRPQRSRLGGLLRGERTERQTHVGVVLILSFSALGFPDVGLAEQGGIFKHAIAENAAERLDVRRLRDSHDERVKVGGDTIAQNRLDEATDSLV